MNIFRFIGDMTHLVSILVLLLKIYATKSCSGQPLTVMKMYSALFLSDLLKDSGTVCSSLLDSIFWAFSIYLEAVAILPQLVLLQRSGNVDNLAGQYIFFLGAYRAFYILNWIYRYFTEDHFSRWIACVSGLVQTALYADFFYYYFISWKNNSKLKLPA
ncbi:hypothetical protein SASPL_132678 [Salvia splendens]|uniref:ER lumen protein-retaining receptor n=1 Tax=Salvia splendens TaxID=180675 RepID=A0A8X8X1E3_SALSN|nr:hypothetical protein SASPL_157418 [Salvia splendens]KAG6405096.1 hypothetical protein SASPL_132678 [Salvia splendens]